MPDDNIKIEGKKEDSSGTLYLIAIGILAVVVIAFLAGVFAIMGYFRGSMSGSGWITEGGGEVDCSGVATLTPEYYEWVKEASGIHLGGDEAALIALIQVESGWNPNAKNPGSSAAGLGQFISSTAKGFKEFVGGDDKHGNSWPTGVVYDNPASHTDDARFDPKRSIFATAHYLSGMIQRYGSLGAAYEYGYHGGTTPEQKAEAKAGRQRLEKIHEELVNGGGCVQTGGAYAGGGTCGDAIAAAENYLNRGINYGQSNHCGPLNTQGPNGVTHLDCSGYISRAYHDAGYLPSSGWCLSTSGIATSSLYQQVTSDRGQAENILQPGDVMIFNLGTSNAHAVLYGGESGSRDIVYESGGGRGGGGGPHKSIYDVWMGGHRQLTGVYRSKNCSN